MPSPNTLIGVVFGGLSKEHDVSIKSATTVISALQSGLNATLYRVLPIYIDYKGRWWGKDVAQKTLQKGLALNESELPVSHSSTGFKGLPPEGEDVDIWYPVLHGPNGEDGSIQGLFKLIGKPFVGSGILASAVGMDKLAMKAAFHSAGLPQVPYSSANAYELENENLKAQLLEKLERQIGYPCFVKPANLGSSVGITKAANKIELIKGLEIASLHDKRIVIEQAINARELECAVLGTQKLQISAVGEIRVNADWYDYEAKYSQNSSQALIPAPLPNEVKERVQNLTLKACQAITAKGMARVDFFYNENADKLWINEINTLPGFTSQSMYPMLWDAVGVNLEQLVAKLVQSARE